MNARLTVLLGLAALLGAGAPARALEADAGGELRFTGFTKYTERNPANVREYDDRQRDAVELDLWTKTVFPGGLLDLSFGELNSSEERGALDLYAGSWLRVNGDFQKMAHRQRFVLNGHVINGQHTLDANTNFLFAGEDLLFKRTTTGLRAMLFCSQDRRYRVNVGVREERERGYIPLQYSSNKQTAQPIDRFTRDISAGAEGEIGSGAAAYEYAARKFADQAPTIIDPSITTFQANGHWPNKYLNWVPTQHTGANRISFRAPLGAGVHLAGGGTALERQNGNTGFKFRSLSGHLGLGARPGKDWSLTARVYDRITETKENLGSIYWNEAVGSGSNYTHDLIDFYQLKGDLQVRYTGFRHASVGLSYKPEHTYRRSADLATEVFNTGRVVYQDGTEVFAEAQVNDVAKEDTRHKAGLSVDFELPADASLGLAYNLLAANRAAFESSPTLGHYQTVALWLPVREHTGFSMNWDRLDERAPGSSYVNLRRRLDRLAFGLHGAHGPVSLGLNYGYERGRDRFTAWFGNSPPIATITNMIRQDGAIYEQTNHVLSGNAATKLPGEFTARGDLAYTRSTADWMMYKLFDPFFNLTPGTTLTNFAPTELDIWRWGLSLSRPLSEALSMRVAYRQELWADKLDSAQSGKAGWGEFALTAKF